MKNFENYFDNIKAQLATTELDYSNKRFNNAFENIAQVNINKKYFTKILKILF